MVIRLPANPPVRSRTRPIRYGPKNPARLPSELISAIAPAAAVPLKNVVGNDQKTGIALNTPIAATDSAISPGSGVRTMAVAPSPTAPMSAAPATCQHRSRWRSECASPTEDGFAMVGASRGKKGQGPTATLAFVAFLAMWFV